MTTPLRVAIIGGGCGAMTAAFELSHPKHQGRYDVTIYQEGWRLGGKGASGRGPAGRIEEHGLHIWMGFYDNSFRMMRACYEELKAAGNSPYGDAFEAFVPEPEIGLFSRDEHFDWQRWGGRFPSRPGLPGDPDPPGQTWSMLNYMRGALSLAQTLMLEVEVARHGGRRRRPDPVWPPDPGVLASADSFTAYVKTLLDRGVFASAIVLTEGLAMLSTALAVLPAGLDSPLLRLAETVAGGVRRWLEDNLLADDHHRHLWEVIDIVLATTLGAIRFGLMTDPRGLAIIDDYDCVEWLRLNGASERSCNSPFIRGLYDLAMAYEDGDPKRPGSAAGNGLRGALRMFFGYRGSLFYRMRAGMGDVVFAPLYDCLKARGVTFEFFHRLTNVGIAGAGPVQPGDTSHVESLTFDVQAVVHGGEYRPLVPVAGRPCWPSAPDWSQLEDGAALAAAGIDFESHWVRHRAGEKRLTVTEDFDFVVLGVSVGAIPHVAPELVARDARWRKMVETTKTTATQAFQIWLGEDLDALGWGGPPYIASAYDKPYDTFCDMAHVVPEEGWAEQGKVPPATAVYFCGALIDPPDGVPEDDAGYPARRTADAKADAIRHLETSAAALWPGLHDAAGGFRWELLADATTADGKGRGPVDASRFDSQYWRANVNPSDRYVLSLPGSIKHRISPLDPTYDNLTIAGDWTASGLMTGCTEAAVMSGLLAAHALSGLPALADITGFDHP